MHIKMAQVASKTCDICVSGPGHHYCEQCDQLFCDGCKISHLRTKMTKNHTFLSGPNINPDVKQYCKEHDENFIYYCKECNSPICKICVIKQHKSHDFAEIKESTEGIKNEVKMVIDMKMRNLQSKIADINQGTHTYQADVQKVIQAIKEEGRHLKEMIDKKVEGLIDTVKEKDRRNVQTLQSDGKELKTALDKAKEQQKVYQDTKGIKDTTKVLQKLKQIKSQIDQIEEMKIPIMPSVKYAKKTVAEGEIGKLFGELAFGETVKKEENPKPKENVRVTRTAKQYRYRCLKCRTEITSEAQPVCSQLRRIEVGHIGICAVAALFIVRTGVGGISRGKRNDAKEEHVFT